MGTKQTYKIFISGKKSFIFSARLARYVQDLDLVSLARKILARKILARYAYFLQDGFYWVICLDISKTVDNS